ncbi:heme oxygenase (biliverdin-producing) [Paenarthrobacter sp. NPDC089714]|uniref:biliverdin-producing heme oxygenase n=1 Tax=Paenarthrobacter sp. NPDC089714 TaxID=3364377 RepID=UPI00381CF249
MTALSEDLKSYTAAAHQNAEESSFVAELLAGRLGSRDVGRLLLQNLVIYRALESALASASDGRLRAFHDPALERVPALERDLSVHFGRDWESRPAVGDLHVTRAARAYADELTAAGGQATAYLLAHHYVRYLGDLSGGQIISTLVQRHYGMSPDGLSFYSFDGLGKLKTYKDAYRLRLDGLQLTPEERSDVLAHAFTAFETNRRVFADLMESKDDVHS